MPHTNEPGREMEDTRDTARHTAMTLEGDLGLTPISVKSADNFSEETQAE